MAAPAAYPHQVSSAQRALSDASHGSWHPLHAARRHTDNLLHAACCTPYAQPTWCCVTGKDSKQLSASTRQAALIAISTLGQALGQSRPKPIIAVLPAMVAAAQDVHRSVRSSALAAAAACLAALGSQALPLLPKLVPAVIAAAQAAVDGLASSSPQDSEVTSHAAAVVLQCFRQCMQALALCVA